MNDKILTNGTTLAKVITRRKDFEAIDIYDEYMQEFYWNPHFLNVLKIFSGISSSFGNLCKSKLRKNIPWFLLSCLRS